MRSRSSSYQRGMGDQLVVIKGGGSSYQGEDEGRSSINQRGWVKSVSKRDGVTCSSYHRGGGSSSYQRG